MSRLNIDAYERGSSSADDEQRPHDPFNNMELMSEEDYDEHGHWGEQTAQRIEISSTPKHPLEKANSSLVPALGRNPKDPNAIEEIVAAHHLLQVREREEVAETLLRDMLTAIPLSSAPEAQGPFLADVLCCILLFVHVPLDTVEYNDALRDVLSISSVCRAWRFYANYMPQWLVFIHGSPSQIPKPPRWGAGDVGRPVPPHASRGLKRV